MFYIRKKVDFERYMVMDTKDGVCELTSREDIESYVKQGVYIAGVSFNKDTSTLEINECSGMPLHELYMKSVVGEVNTVFRKTRFSTDKDIMRYLFETFKSRYNAVHDRFDDFSDLRLSEFILNCVKELCIRNGVSFESVEDDLTDRYNLIHEDCGIKILKDKTVIKPQFSYKI